MKTTVGIFQNIAMATSLLVAVITMTVMGEGVSAGLWIAVALYGMVLFKRHRERDLGAVQISMAWAIAAGVATAPLLLICIHLFTGVASHDLGEATMTLIPILGAAMLLNRIADHIALSGYPEFNSIS